MDKKKVGELEGTPIVIGKKNYANEHEYYLTMNEDNTYQKLEQRVSGDKFRLVLGGGSNNYPTVTAGDVNKVWQVTPVQKGTKTEETVIVPEQTLVDRQELEYNDKFVPGVQCVAVVNGVEYRGEVVELKGSYIFEAEFGAFTYDPINESFVFYNYTEYPEVTAKLSVIEETPIYDYNWTPGVKIPIPTAEDEGKILVVTKVEGDNMSTIVPEQEVPADSQTPLTDVDLKYFVPGNTVTATVTIQQGSDEEEKKGGDVLLKVSESSNSETMIVSGIIKQADDGVNVVFNEGQENEFYILKVPYYEPETPFIPEGPRLINTKSSTDTEYILITNLYLLFDGSSIDDGNAAKLGGNTIPYATIKLEYGEPNYEYQLQENSGSGSGSDYQSSGNIVKDMIEQGPNFNWAKYAIDLSSLPCFKPEAEWPVPIFPAQPDLAEFLSDGYVVVSGSVNRTSYHIIAKQTGDSPSVSMGTNGPVFTDCEPITIETVTPLSGIPAIVIGLDATNPTAFSYVPIFGIPDDSVMSVCDPMFVGGGETLYVGSSTPLNF